MPPRLVLNKFDLDFSTTGFLIHWPTTFFVVDGIVVLDESVVTDGRDAVVPGVGMRTLILSRRGCDGIRHVVMEDEKGKLTKVSKERQSTRGLSEKMGKEFARGDSWITRSESTETRERRGGGERDGRRRERDGQGSERTMGWCGRAFWNGKLFLAGRRRLSWAKEEQAHWSVERPSEWSAGSSGIGCAA